YTVDGFIEVGVVIDDDGVFATHFGDDALDVCLTGCDQSGFALKEQADGARAGECDDCDIGVIDEGGADLFADAVDEVDDASGEACFFENFHEERADDGGLLCGFHDDGVAGDEGGCRHTEEDGEWEIPGCDDEGDAARFVEVLIFFAGDVFVP